MATTIDEIKKLHKFFEIHCRSFGLTDFSKDDKGSYINHITAAFFEVFVMGYESQSHILGKNYQPAVSAKVIKGKLIACCAGKELAGQTSVTFKNTVSEPNSLTVTFINVKFEKQVDTDAAIKYQS